MNAAACIVRHLWSACAAGAARQFAAALRQPEQAQRDVLTRIVRRNRDTQFGRSHRFAALTTHADYQDAVPPRGPAEFLPWIERAAAGEPGVLTATPPQAFLPTSGTASGAKLIPWTAELRREFNAAIHPWIAGFMRRHPAAWRGAAYWSLSPPAWPASHTCGGIRIGFDSDASYVPAMLRPLVERAFAVPGDVAACREVELWRYRTCLHLLAAADLSLVSIWSPVFLTTLLAALPGWWENLLDDLGRGTCRPPWDPARVVRGPRADAGRAAWLRGHAVAGGVPVPARIWPRLAAISCWCDAAARGPAQHLAAMFPGTAVVPKGLLATEGVVSIPQPQAAHPVLAVTSHFLEFMDEQGRVHPAWDLTDGACYRVLLTTGGGLYRYHLHDVVRVTGFHHATPMIEFTGRAGITCDLCGEKLAEPFVRQCLDQTARHCGVAPGFALVAPAAAHCGYVAFLTDVPPARAADVAATLDAALCGNVHYQHARRIGQLAATAVCLLEKPAAAAWLVYQSVHAERGKRLGDIKPSALDSWTGWKQALTKQDN